MKDELESQTRIAAAMEKVTGPLRVLIIVATVWLILDLVVRLGLFRWIHF